MCFYIGGHIPISVFVYYVCLSVCLSISVYWLDVRLYFYIYFYICCSFLCTTCVCTQKESLLQSQLTHLEPSPHLRCCFSDHPGWRQWRWEDISTGSVRPGKVHPWLLLSHRGHWIHSKYSPALPAPEPLYVNQGASQKEVGAYMRPREESH